MKKIMSILFALLLAAAFCTSAFASEIMPLAGNECPNCGSDGYPQYSTVWNGAWVSASGTKCGHGGGYAYNDVPQTQSGVTTMRCPNCGYGSSYTVKHTRTWCSYLNKAV